MLLLFSHCIEASKMLMTYASRFSMYLGAVRHNAGALSRRARRVPNGMQLSMLCSHCWASSQVSYAEQLGFVQQIGR